MVNDSEDFRATQAFEAWEYRRWLVVRFHAFLTYALL
jgi:hypothetical protein